jgi:hypothetical protein
MFVDKVITREVQPTITTSAYSANDIVGGLMTFNVGSPSNCGILNWLKITDADNEGAVLDLYIFNAAPTTIANGDTAALLIADLDKLITKVEVAAADYEAVNSLKFVFKDETSEGMNRSYNADASGNLYMYAVCTATPTYAAATNLKFTLSVLTS